ncbi:hypothetical protein [Cognatishimia maritima]|uniref:EF hand n=1 Tax=Cognatishimia maritima TaxID=870908 RepID=A0A1M5KXP8_9RHOB|nr:hypothetical protein [Cognatishimia maritima]SHG56943.1 EF hand [Cognatishimia maritima]
MIGLMNGLAHGHANRPNPHPQVARLDADKDGTLSLEELEGTKLGKFISDNLEAIDGPEGDGVITKDEFRAFKTGGTTATSGESSYSLTVTIVTVVMELDEIDGAEGEVPVDEVAPPVEDVEAAPSEEPAPLIDTTEGEAAIEIMDSILDSMEEASETPEEPELI